MDLPSQDPLDPYTYTSGRWLRHEKLNRDARCIRFDFDALRKRVVQLCSGVASIASYEKKEGGNNRIFVFTCDNGKRVVARLPTQVAGPPRLTTNSEVATIKYLQSNTTVPIPKILDWSDDSSNAIGSEYIIMEHVAGVQLHQKWPVMSAKQKFVFIQAISKNVQQIAAIDFPAYGSLYFADVPIDSASKVPFTPGFCIGPHCGTMYWDCNVGEARYYISVKPNRGPWSGLAAYCDGLIDTGLSRLPPVDTPLPETPRFHGSIAAHTRLLTSGRDVIHKLSNDPRIVGTAAPTLYHADLHKRNIFVSDNDPTIITGLIDWQSSSVEPAFEYAGELPDFAAPSLNILKEDQPADQPTDTIPDLCSQAFDAFLKIYVPRLSAARAFDDNLLRPFRYCHRTWRDGAVAFRQELVETSTRWKDLGLSDSCPYPVPTSDELVVHAREYKDFEVAYDMKQKLAYLLDTNTDGWVPTEAWEATKLAHKQAVDIFMQTARDGKATDDDTISEADMRKIWPFDIIE
ncbi:MAG: hypothetical protein Q9212_007389 [Teloschistes hypoglaucus]